MNKIILKGSVGCAPKIWRTKDRREIVTFPLATNTSWKDDAGEWQTSTDWHSITVFRESSVRWIKYLLKKGDSLYVEGKLSYHRWTDKHNRPRYTSHIIVSGREGKIEHLRHHKPPAGEEDNSENSQPEKIPTEREIKQEEIQ